MTIYSVLLARGYLPKELPPVFFSELFAKYATSKAGRKELRTYKPNDNLTEYVRYELALAGGHRRTLSILHPFSYAATARLVAKHFRRPLRRSASTISRSRPVFSDLEGRAIKPAFRLSNLARERAIVRAGSRYLLRVDVSHFYPSLYTHAIGWAIDPKLRQKKHWKNFKLLGKQVDQYLMDAQGKISQGVPIGNDLSFLLAEVVLTQIDRALKLPEGRAFRWFDDYEIGCATSEEANLLLANFQKALDRFNLRVNETKTRICELPLPAAEPWQTEIYAASRRQIGNVQELVAFFDVTFSLKNKYPDSYVLNYAIGLLFKLPALDGHALRVAESVLTQAILTEAGSVHKALALLTYWAINGASINKSLLRETISRMIVNQRNRGLSSDVAWGLLYCLQNGLHISAAAARAIAETEDNCILLMALHMKKAALLPASFKARLLSSPSATDPDGRNWLLLYEAHRGGFVNVPLVAAHPLFKNMLLKKVAFYRENLPSYATLIHPGGAPDWIVRRWVTPPAAQPIPPAAPTPSVIPIPAAPPAAVSSVPVALSPVQRQIAQDVASVIAIPRSAAEAVMKLLDLQVVTPDELDVEDEEVIEEPGGYGGI